ncbi:glutamyl-tRNA reductase [Aestuariimicrobium sp. T2.26MG-19.2B]|uniref:glutamyl-tRNA reductase n=1 Tax=Aestuariimicrobium sp. T2.26MG-19.2B TaxID=3040679 RepID=UPI0024779BA4|nr:glutamyl-tRNA reductase [Aestuariimicrobium sp. T2.26MG-19.2B]CAI9405258.1 Glutamyl-tRNA reductase [Aestuariimicrobium sp. T2.26MG-19.2B]
MNLLTLSISHRTAPISTVEQVALDGRAADLVQARLLTNPGISEALVLSTCNRTEVHLISDRFHTGLDAIADALGSQTGLDRESLGEICDVAWDEAAVHHVFNLVAGLESLVVGESQVIGQVREALLRGQRRHAVGRELNSLFQNALRVGKRVQSETAIGHAGRSVFTAALDLAQAQGISLDRRRTLVIGAGQMAGLTARGMHARGADLVCINRTRQKADRLAGEVGGRAANLSDLPELLGWAEVVITCTGAAHSLIDPRLLAGLEHRPDVIIDLALPADVDDAVAEHTTLVNLTTLAAASEGDHSHDTEVAAARALVAEEVADQLRADRSKAVTPAVVALRAMADQVVEAERARLVRRSQSAGQPLSERQLDEVSQALQRVAEKLVHAPSVEARQLAGTDVATDYADMLRRLFRLDLDEVADPAAAAPEHCDTHAALIVASPRLGLTDPIAEQLS